MAGNAEIGALRVSLGLDTANLETGVKRVKSEVKGLSGDLASMGAALATAVTPIGLATAAALTLGKALGAVPSALSFADDIADTAKKLAVSTDALQEYRFAVHALGGEYKDADAALEGFSKAFGAAHAKMSAKAVKPFKQLGLDPESFATTEDALKAVIDKISKLKSTAEQAAIADKLGLTAMLPAIRSGISEIEKMRQRAHELGAVMDAELVERAGDINDEFQDLSTIAGVQLKSALVDLAPVLTGLLDLVGKMAREANAIADAFRSIDQKTGSGLQERRAALVAEASRTGARAIAGERLSPGERDRLARVNSQIAQIDAEIADRAKRSQAPAPSGTSLAPVSAAGGGGRDRSGQVRLASESAIDSAARAELQARMALTGDLQKLTDLRRQQIDAETSAANARLEEEASQGRITKAAADKAIALNNDAAQQQKILLDRQAAAEAARRELDRAQLLGQYSDDLVRIQAELAGTAEERAGLERAGLIHRQELDRRRLESELKIQLDAGEIDAAYQKEVLAAQASAQAAELRAADRKAQAQVEREAVAKAEAALQLQIDLLGAQQDLGASAYERRNIQLRILAAEQRIERLKLEEIAKSKDVSDAERDEAKARLAALPKLQDAKRKEIEESVTLIDALKEAADAVSSMADSIRRGHLGEAVSSLGKVLSQVAGMTGSSSGLGATLKAFSSKLGTIGTAMEIGQSITSAFGQKQTKGGQIGGGVGAVVGSVFGPIGAVIGSTIGNAIGNLFKGGKESNYGALATISGNGFALSGDKRNAQTTQLATQAAQAILNGQAALKAAGIKLNATVQSIDIGTRDATDIILSDGRKLTSAVGDAGAAAEAGLKALLSGATYASDAQKKLVESMLAAGRSFDDIAVSLDQYAQAQAIPQQIADAILNLTDPQGFQVAQTKREQQARRDQAKAALDEGLLTAEQFAAVNDQLTRLEALELDDVMKRFASAADQAAGALLDNVDTARQALADAVQAETSAIQDRISTFKALADSLSQFSKSLADQINPNGSSTRDALAAEFERVAREAALGNPDAMGSLKTVGQQLVDASKSSAATRTDYMRDLARVKGAVDQAQAVAERQVDLGQQQLDAMNAQVRGLIEVNGSVLTVAEAIAGLQAALTGYESKTGQKLGVNPSANAALAKATGFKGDFGSGGFQAWIVQQDEATKAAARRVLQAFGQSYRISGFATGGSFKVGGFGATDSQLMQFMATPGEMVEISKGDPKADMTAEIRALRADLRAIGAAGAANAAQINAMMRRWNGDGLPETRAVA